MRKTLFLLGALGLALLVSACGGDSGDDSAGADSTNSTEPAQQSTTAPTGGAGDDTAVEDSTTTTAEADQEAEIVPIFPVVDGVVQLPAEPSADALTWLADQVLADATDLAAIETRFAPSFLAAVPAADVAAVIDTTRSSLQGDFVPLDVRVASSWFVWAQMGNPQQPQSTFLTRLQLDPETGLIDGFQIVPSRSGLGTWIYPEDTSLDLEQAVAGLGATTGAVSAVVAEITEDGCSVMAGVNETERRGIASLFKTWVLGALAAAVESGDIAPDDVVTFTPGQYLSAGSGASGRFVDERELTVQEAANLMMNISDNGATDVLHRLLGQDAIDEFVQGSGHTEPDALTPLLPVNQFAHLYGTLSASEVDTWLAATEEEQRVFLDEVLTPLGTFEQGSTGNPPVDRLNWQASPLDVCETMANMRARFASDSPAGRLIDQSFGGEVFLFGLRNEWDRVWYKGGGHPGLTAGNFAVRTDGWMVESNDGRTFAVVAMYNTEPDEAPEDPTVFVLQSLYARIHQILSNG